MKLHVFPVPLPKFRRFSQSRAFLKPGLALALVLGLSACQEKQPRTYTEVAFKPNPELTGPMGRPMAGGLPGDMGRTMSPGPGAMPPMNADPINIKVSWVLPETWQVKDSASAMRIGSFSVPDPIVIKADGIDLKAVDVSVVQLAGSAGGLIPNINRWMGQIGIKATPDELNQLIKSSTTFKTKSGQSGLIIDLTDKLSGDLTQSKTIYAGIVTSSQYTVFVKGMGERERVVKIKAQIKAFCQSLLITGPEA